MKDGARVFSFLVGFVWIAFTGVGFLCQLVSLSPDDGNNEVLALLAFHAAVIFGGALVVTLLTYYAIIAVARLMR